MKKEMKALIDGDVLVYWSANWGQTNYFDVINSGGEVLDSRAVSYTHLTLPTIYSV